MHVSHHLLFYSSSGEEKEIVGDQRGLSVASLSFLPQSALLSLLTPAGPGCSIDTNTEDCE
jgi:hypothetical protein